MAESSLVGSCAQALQEQPSGWVGHQHTLPAHSWATGLGVLPAPGEQWVSRVEGMRHRHPQKTTGAGSHGSSLRGGWWVGCHGQGPSRGTRPGLQPQAHSRESGGEWERSWSSPTQGCVRIIPAPALSCQAAQEQPSCGRPPPIPASAWLSPPYCMAQGQEDPCSIPFPGLLRPVEKHIRSHPATRGSGPSIVSGWS